MGTFITYAQNNEDVILDAYFSDITAGFYVDIGANHPIEDSVTQHFYQKGWTGINVEPIKRLFDLIVIDRARDITVQVGISDKPGTLKLREYANHGLSTFSLSMKQQYGAHTSGKTIKYKDLLAPVITLRELFETHNVQHIHFMKVDVEGLEFEVLHGNDWTKYRPEMICIESNHNVKDWRPILAANGYEKVWDDGLNDYYLAVESSYRKAYFSYSDAILLGDQIMPYHVDAKISELSDQVLTAQQQLRDNSLRIQVQAIKIKQLQHENHLLCLELAERDRFSRAATVFARSIDRIILAQIERLRFIRARRVIKPKRGNEFSYVRESKRELLASILVADIQASYAYRKRLPAKQFYIYRLTRCSYTEIKRLVKILLKALLGLKNRGKNV